jgi:hypothetical protein
MKVSDSLDGVHATRYMYLLALYSYDICRYISPPAKVLWTYRDLSELTCSLHDAVLVYWSQPNTPYCATHRLQRPEVCISMGGAIPIDVVAAMSRGRRVQ